MKETLKWRGPAGQVPNLGFMKPGDEFTVDAETADRLVSEKYATRVKPDKKLKET